MPLIIHIGHPVYSGANSYKQHNNTKDALSDLVERGVPPHRAVRALNQALEGSHATVSAGRARILRSSEGNWYVSRPNVVELRVGTV